MQLDQIWINPETQDLYAKIIAIEDIITEYCADDESNNNPQPNKGETNNEVH